MKLTPLKVLVELFGPKELEEYEQYKEELERAEDLGLKSPLRPKVRNPEYKIRWYNFENYIIDGWSTDWDVDRDCPMIIVNWWHVHTNSISVMNVQMTESEWIKFLSKLGYSHDQ